MSNLRPAVTHVGEVVQLPALVLTDHAVQQHALRAVQLLGRHGDLDVIKQRSANYRRKSHDQRETKLDGQRLNL